MYYIHWILLNKLSALTMGAIWFTQSWWQFSEGLTPHGPKLTGPCLMFVGSSGPRFLCLVRATQDRIWFVVSYFLCARIPGCLAYLHRKTQAVLLAGPWSEPTWVRCHRCECPRCGRVCGRKRLDWGVLGVGSVDWQAQLSAAVKSLALVTVEGKLCFLS